jgi:hypothetical protein
LLVFIGALFTKVLLLAVLPAFVYLAWGKRPTGFWKMTLVGLGAIVSMALLLSLLAPQNRLSLDFFERLWRLRRGFPYEDIPQALLEMLVSPAKGLLVYSPVLLLIPFGWMKNKQTGRRLVNFSLLAAAGLMLAQAAAYGSEWWSITWGTRFLLPVLPLLAAGLAPAVEFLLESRHMLAKVLLWGLALVGIIIQLGGVLVSNSAYTIELYYNQLVPDLGRVLWSIRLAPLAAHWRLLMEGAELNLAFIRCWQGSPALVAGVVGGCMLLIAGGLIAIFRVLKGKEEKPRWLWSGVFLAFALPGLLLSGYRLDPRYGANRADVRALAEVLEEQAQPGDVVLVFPYLRTTWNYFMNFYRGEADWFSLPNTFPAGEMSSTMTLVEGFGDEYQRVWLVSEMAAWEPTPSFVEGYLQQFGETQALAVFTPVEENLQLRLVLYSLESLSD